MLGLARRFILSSALVIWPDAENVPNGIFRAYPREMPSDWEYGPHHHSDVVFIHGVGGHPRHTWQLGKDNRLFWPAWVGEQLPGVRVLTVGYPSGLSLWQKRADMNIPSRADGILDVLLSNGVGSRPFAIVCHSMGGLIAKAVLRRLEERRAELGDVLANARGILFLGTPHGGSNLADVLSAVSGRFVSASGEGLKADNVYLKDLNDWFGRVPKNHPGIKLKIYYESLRLRVMFGLRIVQVVPTNSATLPNVDCFEVDRDHSELTRCADRYDPIFAGTVLFLSDCLHPVTR